MKRIEKKCFAFHFFITLLWCQCTTELFHFHSERAAERRIKRIVFSMQPLKHTLSCAVLYECFDLMRVLSVDECD